MKKSGFTLIFTFLVFSIIVSTRILSQNLSEMKKDSFISYPNIENDYPEINTFIPVDEEPVPIRILPPEYPTLALRAGLTGTIYIKILVDVTGRVKYPIVLKTPSYILIKPALKAALKSIFRPAIKNGENVPYWVVIPYQFKLF